MNEERRRLMLEVNQGHPAGPPYLYHLDRFKRCDEILRWLIRNKITGERFIGWVRGEYEGSILRAGAAALQAIDRESGPRKIIGGKDYLLS